MIEDAFVRAAEVARAFDNINRSFVDGAIKVSFEIQTSVARNLFVTLHRDAIDATAQACNNTVVWVTATSYQSYVRLTNTPESL